MDGHLGGAGGGGAGQGGTRVGGAPAGEVPISIVTRVRRPVALCLALLLLGNVTLPMVAQAAQAQAPAKGGQGGQASGGPSPAAPGQGSGAPSEPPAQGGPPQEPEAKTADSLSATTAGTSASPPLTTFTVQAFQTDLFTGATTAEFPLPVPPGTAGVAPRLTLRYNSSTVDELPLQQQGQGTGLGWTLEAGGFILRDPKGTTDTGDDTFKIVFGGESEDLVLVDAAQNLYRTKDEHFWRIKYDPQGDFWTLTTKDGTRHRFGTSPASRASTINNFYCGGGFPPALLTYITYKYFLDEVATPGGPLPATPT